VTFVTRWSCFPTVSVELYELMNLWTYSGDVWPALCQNAERREWWLTGLTTMSHCQVMVSRMARVSIATLGSSFA